MPHATETLTNGEKSSSKFLSHLTSYPAVHDGIETYKSNPYGKKSLEFADGAYSRFGKPVEPYLEKPYTYAKPYVQKADELGVSGLTKIEGHFPIVKEQTGTIVDTAKSYIFWPYTYVFDTWNDEYTKTVKHNDRGPGITSTVQAIISTELHILQDGIRFVSDIIRPRYEESKKKRSDYVREIENNVDHYKKVAGDKINDYTKLGQEKANEAQKVGEQKFDDAKKEANKTKEEAKQKAHK